MAVLSAMVHGLSQGPQFGLSCSLEGPDGLGRFLLPGHRALGQDLLQGEDVILFFLSMRQKLPEYISKRGRFVMLDLYYNSHTYHSTRCKEKNGKLSRKETPTHG